MKGALSRWPEETEAFFRLYRFAKKAGCLFYCSSDAHKEPKMDGYSIPDIIPRFAGILGLDKNDRFYITKSRLS
jgi:histidinol phosphatase-like PHP family hydrolase